MTSLTDEELELVIELYNKANFSATMVPVAFGLFQKLLMERRARIEVNEDGD